MVRRMYESMQKKVKVEDESDLGLNSVCVVRFLVMDSLSGSAGVVMGRDSWILVSLVLNTCFETVD
ncbi:hypothetical protein HanXRQr2_Chr07g0287271 [Helianthus annuus]|uniref:Uncharacterized protein n=1 Tax=Helianthus annuus TaxID=4232 RepID=A0A9K3IJ82_HELAN|nr:hypothetical protein HanXRQr2_Chr07g0287271 [Helianthus annuus]KAJ0904110.1 hypothetical protein HanPSC8_Chr07g0278071 [Helianthus annuus]